MMKNKTLLDAFVQFTRKAKLRGLSAASARTVQNDIHATMHHTKKERRRRRSVSGWKRAQCVSVCVCVGARE